MGCTHGLDVKGIHNFDGEAAWKVFVWKAEMEVEE